MSKPVVAAGPRRFGSQTLSPEVAAQVVAYFHQALPIHFLAGEPAIACQFPGGLQHHPPESVPIAGVARAIARDPVLDSRPVIGRGIVAHGVGIREDAGQRFDVFGNEFAKDETRGFKNCHAAF